jgi:hypothetical protein
MARALVASVVLFAAGEEAGFVFGAAVAFGDADGLALGEGDFFVAAEAAKGTQHATAAMQAVIRLSLFFIGGVVQGLGSNEFLRARQCQPAEWSRHVLVPPEVINAGLHGTRACRLQFYSSGLPCSSGSHGNVSGPFSVQTA